VSRPGGGGGAVPLCLAVTRVREGCFELSGWKAWDQQRLERCFRRDHVSGRRVVHGYSDVIRCFHVHNLTDDDTVLFVML
jgi:hypothetical protein